jgi:Flp pilus assembly protein TadD
VEDAIAEYHATLRQRPAYADTHYRLGIALRANGGVDRAIVEYRVALWWNLL